MAHVTRDWKFHAQRCEEEHIDWLRSLAPREAFSLYESLCSFAASLPGDPAGADRLERRRWQEKLAARKRLVQALTRWEQVRSGRRDPTDAG